MSAGPPRHILATIPLGRDTVLLPGVTLRIPIGTRADIPALLAKIYTSASTPRGDPTSMNMSVGCVPLCSPLLSHEGENLSEDSEFRTKRVAESLVEDPSGAKEKDLFIYGVEAKITGVTGQKGQLALTVEGFRRFRIERFTQFKPYRECEVTDLPDVAPDPGDSEVQALFQKLKDLSKELLTIVRLSSLLPRATAILSPILARRLELFIAKKEFHEWGVLCDFMTNVVDSTYEDRLRVLSALEPKVRLERVIDLLRRQIDGMQGNVKITSITRTEIPAGGIDITKLPPSQRDALVKRSGMFPGSLPAGFGMPGRRGGDEDDEGPNEIEELKKKLDEAGLSPEAQKVADKEIRRLKKMNPAQADYNVCRTYLENLSEIPWTKTTEDQLGTETLKRARRQLDEDHYGLEKVKKRLLEYLAVLKLKQAINQNLENEIGKAAEEEKALEEKRQNDKKAAKESAKLLEDSKDKKEDKPKQKPAKDPRPESAKLQILRSKRQVDKSPILLLVGPPGVGKTSLAKSIATALGRQFHRISLGGVRDEAEIRGHRRTYVAAMPGVIVQGLKKVGVSNPVFLLDEIDKVGGSNFHGDPSAAMLEVLDPEQNNTFTDHYVNIPIDLSKVLFIATANTLDTIPAPLLDRMETINLSGYTTIEKRHIANRHLIPKQIRTNGLAEKQVVIPDNVLDTIITDYTRESGVRNLEREIGSVCRYKAVQYSDAKDLTISKEEQEVTPTSPKSYNPEVSMDELDTILGHTRYELEIADSEASIPGIVTGLVAFSYGGMGSILFIEVADMPGGSGRVQLTGKLGDVLKESVEVALSWVKSHSYDLGLTSDTREDIMSNRSIHVHCPAGGVPKDGPSAGVAHTIALISLFSGRAVSPQIAMTGEMSLRGRVLPVGGIKEKLIGAHRAGVKTVLLPKKNEKDLDDLPDEVRNGMKIIPIRHVWEAVRLIWPDEHWPRQTGFEDLESRL